MPQAPRPPRIAVAALIAAVGSGLAFVLGLLALMGALFYPSGMTGAPSRELLIAAPALLFVLGGWGLVTARGLMGLKPWARISILVFAALLAFMGAMGTFFLLTTNIPAPPGITPSEFRVIRGAVAVTYFLFLAVGVWWITEFSSPAVGAAFRGEREAVPSTPVPPPPVPDPWQRNVAKVAKPRPLSITFIGWYLLAAAISSAVQIVIGAPATIFGMTVSGTTASLLYLGMFAAQGYIGVGLLQLQRVSRILAVCFFLLQYTATVLIVALPGRGQRLAAMLHAVSGTAPPEISQATAFTVLLISGAIATALPVWFLVKHKNAFAPKQPET